METIKQMRKELEDLADAPETPKKIKSAALSAESALHRIHTWQRRQALSSTDAEVVEEFEGGDE